jgi:hypothetical protein
MWFVSCEVGIEFSNIIYKKLVFERVKQCSWIIIYSELETTEEKI